MGGFTEVFLKDCSYKNIKKQNEKLREYNVAKQYSFYSKDDVKFEYESFCKGEGNFPERLFPRDKINSYEDFIKYWSTEALGSLYVPRFGTLTFDCYFGRTSKRAMRNMGRYIADNVHLIKKTNGSFSTFIERGMTRKERQIIKENKLD